MIAYLRGTVQYVTADAVVLNVNGVGYEVFCSGSAHVKLWGGKEGEVYTYLQVKEDGVALYGFSSLDEKNMFLKLISVSGVGPKMGIAVLSAMSTADLAAAIAMSDVRKLCTVKGLGKKTAERIVLELKEKVAKDAAMQSGASDFVAAPQSGDEDAILGLMSMGFTRAECEKGVKAAHESGASTIEEIIQVALRNLYRG